MSERNEGNSRPTVMPIRSPGASGVLAVTYGFLFLSMLGVAMGVAAMFLGIHPTLDSLLQDGVSSIVKTTGLSSILGSGILSVDKELVEEANRNISKLPSAEQPLAVIKWANQTFGPSRLAQFTSFGPSGLVLSHVISQTGLLQEIPMVTIDTLHLFKETEELRDRVQTYFGLGDNLKVFKCRHASSRKEFEDFFGPRLWRTDPLTYDYLTKIEPTRRALDSLRISAWFTGRRTTQGGERKQMPVIESDPTDGRVKLNPMAGWSKEEVWAYIKEKKIPYNALHDQGYMSIGDTVSTVPVAAGQDERSGRWSSDPTKSECGMHVATSSDSLRDIAKRADRIKEGYTWDLAARARSEAAGVVTATEHNFESVVIRHEGHVLFEVYAPWCGHCQAFEHDFNKLPNLLSTHNVRVVRFDGFQNKIPAQFAEQYLYKGFPTLILALHGNKTSPSKYLGAKDVKEIVTWVSDTVSAADTNCSKNGA